MADPRQTVPSLLVAEVTVHDLALAFENRERYIAQSAATKAGAPAPLPARSPISRDLNPPK